jgi:hypothetical protein
MRINIYRIKIKSMKMPPDDIRYIPRKKAGNEEVFLGPNHAAGKIVKREARIEKQDK